jgi:hypothetical protein
MFLDGFKKFLIKSKERQLRRCEGHLKLTTISKLTTGPFWICATLVFAIAICGNLSKFLVNLGSPNYKYTAEFGKGTSCFYFQQGQCYNTKAVL